MTVVASANGSHNGAESARLKTEGHNARSRGGDVGQRKTARVRLLPDENPGEFRERMTWVLFDSLQAAEPVPESRWLNALSSSNGGSIGSSARSGLGCT